jgi:hypothetical protein
MPARQGQSTSRTPRRKTSASQIFAGVDHGLRRLIPGAKNYTAPVRTVDFDVELDVDARRPREEVKRHNGRFYHEKGLGKATQRLWFRTTELFC